MWSDGRRYLGQGAWFHGRGLCWVHRQDGEFTLNRFELTSFGVRDSLFGTRMMDGRRNGLMLRELENP